MKYDRDFSPMELRQENKLAEHPLLSNSKHAQNLPQSWATLYQLARVEPRLLHEVQAVRDRLRTEIERAELAGRSARDAWQFAQCVLRTGRPPVP